jgi:hypothetical protein
VNSYDRDLDAIATWERESSYAPRTGPRRELAICYECGREIEQPSQFDATCGDQACREQAAGRSQR